MMVDLQTRMDSTRYHKEKLTFSYYYTLKDVYRDSLFLAQTPAEMEVNMIEALRNSAEFRAYQAAGITMQYVYFAAETGKELFRIDIPANRY